MKKTFMCLFIGILQCSLAIIAQAQIVGYEPTKSPFKKTFYQFYLPDNKRCAGYIVEQDADKYVLYTDMYGEITINANALEKEEIPDACVYVRMFDRQEFTGRLVSFDKDEVRFTPLLESLYYTNSKAGSEIGLRRGLLNTVIIAPFTRFKNGKYWFDTNTQFSYALGASAYPLQKGSVMINTFYSLVPSVQFGVSDRWTIGGGTELISVLGGNLNLYGNAKYSIPITSNRNPYKRQVSAAFMATAGIYGLRDVVNGRNTINYISGGILQAMITSGTVDRNFSIGLGAMRLQTDEPVTSYFVRLGSVARFSRKLAFLGEFWAITNAENFSETPAAPMLGLRIYGQRRYHLDIALLIPSLVKGSGNVVPYFNVRYPINN